MRVLLTTLLLGVLLPVSCTPAFAQEDDAMHIQWFGENESANTMVGHGIWFMTNIEFDKSIAMFQSALHEDSTLFGPHVALANMGSAAHRQMHIDKAKELVEGKNEMSRLFVSSLDIGQDDSKAIAALWTKMYNLNSEAGLVHFYYAMTMENPAEGMAELTKLAAKNEENDKNNAAIHNILGYMTMGAGDMEAAKMHFEAYIKEYSGGYNPYDSMGDFYYTSGDMDKALENYRIAVQNYPGARNATNRIEAIEAEMNEEEGGLILLNIDHIHPEYLADYWKWGEEYKAMADKDGAATFWVSSSNQSSMSYAAYVGNTMEDFEEYQSRWQEWASTPEMVAQYEKYKHTVDYSEEQLWRHSPSLSYTPESYEAPEFQGYVRTIRGFVNYGETEEVVAIFAEMKEMANENGVVMPWSVYWNVYGEEGGCFTVRMPYENEEEYLAKRYDMREKVGQEKMREVNSRLMPHLRSFKENEVFPQKELTHTQSAD